MPRIKVDHIYIADGLAEDCEELMLKCSQVSKLSYEKFCDIWKELDFSCIFHGRQTGAELAEFSEEALHVAKHFMVSNIGDYEKSVAGLFLVYAILNLQPYSKFAALRIVQEDVEAIKQLELVARRERRIDILYILGEVLVKGPCQYHVSARERGLDYCLRKYFDGYIQHAFVGQKPRGVFHRHNEEINLMKEISLVEERYHKAKSNLSVEQDPSLQYVNCNLGIELQTSLKGIASGVVETIKEPISVTPVKKTITESESVSLAVHHDNVQSIKMKALKNVVNPIRHLTGVQQRASEPVPSTSASTKNKTPPKSTRDSKRTRRKSDSPEQIMSPTKYPWSIKPLFSESDEEVNKTILEANKTTFEDNNTISTEDMVQIELESLDDEKDDQNDIESISKNNNESKKESQNNRDSNICNTKLRRNPRKNASPRKIRKLDFEDTTDSKLNEPYNDVTVKSSKRKNTQKGTCQLVDISIDRIPKEISVNNNVEFEIIDQFTSPDNQNAVQPSTSKEKVTGKEKASRKSKVTDEEKVTSKKRGLSKDKAPSEQTVSSDRKVINDEKVTSKKRDPSKEKALSKQSVSSDQKVINEEKVTSKKRDPSKDKALSEQSASSDQKVINEEKVTSIKRGPSKDKAPSEQTVTSKEKVASGEIVPRKKMKLDNAQIKRQGIAQFKDDQLDSDYLPGNHGNGADGVSE